VIVVVADTAPLRYLIQIDCHEFLAVLFKQVLIPIAVWEELRDEKAPLAVRLWAEQPPGWMKTCRINSTPGEDLWELDDGEREAIQLAEEVGADLLLVDERAGARIARQKGLMVTGTLGILLEAERHGLLSIDEALERLAKTNFRRTAQLFEQVKNLSRQRGVG
jgi:predicted nucleic acid-binding protein